MPAKREIKVASKSWRGKIESHETFSHDSLDSLAYDWERIGNPKIHLLERRVLGLYRLAVIQSDIGLSRDLR